MGAGPGRGLRMGADEGLTVGTAETTAVEVVDLAVTPLRELNQRLHDLAGGGPGPRHWRVVNPNGAHAVACGIDADVEVEIAGHVGYYCAGMNKLGTVRVHGNAGPGLAENIMSGLVVVDGNASQSAAATGRGGLVVVHGDAGEALGDSIYEARVYVRGEVAGLGADCVEKELREEHAAELRDLLARAGIEDADPADFRRYGSARELYTFKVDNAGSY